MGCDKAFTLDKYIYFLNSAKKKKKEQYIRQARQEAIQSYMSGFYIALKKECWNL